MLKNKIYRFAEHCEISSQMKLKSTFIIQLLDEIPNVLDKNKNKEFKNFIYNILSKTPNEKREKYITSSFETWSISDLEKALKILGGAKTVIVPVNPGVVHDIILGSGYSLGIRIPNHPFCKALSSSCKVPIITTSVNRSGEQPLEIPHDISITFGNKIKLMIEDGKISGDASTIYQYQDGDFIITR